MRTLTLVLVAGLGTASGLRAQEVDVPSRAAIHRLDFLVGEWAGEATVLTRSGRLTLRQTELVRYSNSGHALVIEGTGWQADSTGAEHIAFNAVAILTHDPQAGYHMRSATMDGRTGDFELTLDDHGFTWGFDTPQVHTRYTMRLTPEGEWHEVGEFSRDGTEWRQFIELRVRKVTPGR
jgi:hypothetical protein